MTSQDCIRCLKSNKNLFVRGSENCKGEALELHNQYISSMDYAIKAIEFAKFTGKMLFDDWETDCKDLYPELACRRLVELGIVELNDGVYSLKESEEEDADFEIKEKIRKALKMDEDAKQASIPYTYNAPQHDWKCGYPSAKHSWVYNKIKEAERRRTMSDITRYKYQDKLLKVTLIFSIVALLMSAGMFVLAAYLMFGG